MAVKIRLFRVGKKKQAYYRVVAKEERSARQGRYLEELGFFDPLANPEQAELKADRIKWWLDHGAVPTETVARLIGKHTDIPVAAKYLPKFASPASDTAS